MSKKEYYAKKKVFPAPSRKGVEQNKFSNCPRRTPKACGNFLLYIQAAVDETSAAVQAYRAIIDFGKVGRWEYQILL